MFLQTGVTFYPFLFVNIVLFKIAATVTDKEHMQISFCLFVLWALMGILTHLVKIHKI